MDDIRDMRDEELMLLCAQGNLEAFSVLFHRYQKKILNFAWLYLNDMDSAEDILQGTFLRMFMFARTFKKKASFSNWLYTIASNKARDYLRSRSRRPTVQISAHDDDQDVGTMWAYLMTDHTTAEDIFFTKQQKELVREIVGKLPDHLRQILILAYFSKLSYQEMADILEIPLGTVKSRLHSAVAFFGRLYREQTKVNDRNTT